MKDLLLNLNLQKPKFWTLLLASLILALFFFFIFSSPSQDQDHLKDLQHHIKTSQKKCTQCQDLNNTVCVKERIHCFYETDQYVRNQTAKILFDQRLIDLYQQMDSFHTAELKSILKIYGWLNISKFGKETDHEAWMLVQHADLDRDFQASIAFLLEQLVVLGETNPVNFAYLYDRVAVKHQDLGIKQKYGTQAEITENMVKIKPYMGNLRELNLRRKKIGMDTVENYIKELRKVYLDEESNEI